MSEHDSEPVDPVIAAATLCAAAQVPASVDRAGDNTPTQPGTEAAEAAAGTNETRDTETEK